MASAPAERADGAPRGRTNAARLFGHDFFISFALGPAPRGTQSYSSDLARRLRERDFTVFFSEDEAPPGDPLDATLRAALNRARILVVIVNHATLAEPRWVRKEVEEFRRRRPDRPVIPVSVGGALGYSAVANQAQEWLQHNDAIWLEESEDAVSRGLVSEHVMDRLVVTPRSTRANVRWRWVLRLVAATVASLTIGLGVAAWLANKNRLLANESAERARTNEQLAVAARRTAESRALGNAARLLIETPKGNWDNKETDRCLVELGTALAVHGTRLAITSESDAALRSGVRRLGGEERVIALERDGVVSWGVAADGSVHMARSSGDRVVIERVDIVTRRREILRSLSAKDFDSKLLVGVLSRDGAWAGLGGVDGDGRRTLSLLPIASLTESPIAIGNSMAFAALPNSNEVVTLPEAFELQFWRLTPGGTERQVVALSGRPLGGLAVNPTGTLVAVGFQESNAKEPASVDRVLVLEVSTKKRILPDKFIQGATVSTLEFSPDGRWLAAGDLGSKVVVWNVTNGEAVASFALDDQLAGVMFSSNSRYLATAEQRGRVRIWDMASKAAVAQIDSEIVMPTVAWAMDRHLLVGGASLKSGRPGVYVAFSDELEAVACRSLTMNPHPVDLRGRVPDADASITCAGKPVRTDRCRHSYFY